MEGSTARPLGPLPKSLIRLRDGRVVARRSGFADPGDSILCPFGHRVTPLLDLHEGAAVVQCKVRGGKGGLETGHEICGCCHYVVTTLMGLYWIDITSDENEHRKRFNIRPSGMAKFLGIHFPSS
jgi:hypothetical protein